MLETNELKSIGVSAALILVNFAFMWALAYTPVALFLGIAFSIPIAGIIVYGAMLTAGNYLAERGLKRDQMELAVLGVVLLQVAYASFGAGLLAMVSLELQAIAVAVTALLTTLIGVVAAAVVYGTGRDFSSWNLYATFFFIGVLVLGALGTVVPPILLLAFISALLGFIVLLVYEIWELKTQSSEVYVNGIGIYVAFMGVFIMLLQIIIRLLARR